jgi:hypothetical protein
MSKFFAMVHIETCAPTLKEAVENLVEQGAASENKKPVLWGILPP